jgi:hypothetical protein
VSGIPCCDGSGHQGPHAVAIPRGAVLENAFHEGQPVRRRAVKHVAANIGQQPLDVGVPAEFERGLRCRQQPFLASAPVGGQRGGPLQPALGGRHRATAARPLGRGFQVVRDLLIRTAHRPQPALQDRPQMPEMPW